MYTYTYNLELTNLRQKIIQVITVWDQVGDDRELHTSNKWLWTILYATWKMTERGSCILVVHSRHAIGRLESFQSEWTRYWNRFCYFSDFMVEGRGLWDGSGLWWSRRNCRVWWGSLFLCDVFQPIDHYPSGRTATLKGVVEILSHLKQNRNTYRHNMELFMYSALQVSCTQGRVTVNWQWLNCLSKCLCCLDREWKIEVHIA